MVSRRKRGTKAEEGTKVKVVSPPTIAKKSKKPKKLNNINTEMVEESIVAATVTPISKTEIKKNGKTEHLISIIIGSGWNYDDLSQLIARMHKHLSARYKEHWNISISEDSWEQIAFGDHSPQDCKNIWNPLLNRMRKFKILKEVVQDAKNFLNDIESNGKKITKRKKKKQSQAKNSEMQMDVSEDKSD